MNSQVMVVLAILLLIGAGVAGYWGLSMGQEAAPATSSTVAVPAVPQVEQSPLRELPAAVVAESRSAVVVLARDVEAFDRISEDDLVVEDLRIAPPGSFSSPDEVTGRQVWRTLPAGSILNDNSFTSGGPLARMIRDNERALAIEINEVVANGGHLAPGDYVDVLLFLREDEKNSDRTMQVVVPALRVLSIGASLGLDLAGEPAAPPPDEGDSPKREAARSAVLAVPDALVTRFALAAQVGSLRLAVRSAEEQRLARFYQGDGATAEKINQNLFQFEKLALAHAARPQPGLVSPRATGIPVFRGSTLSRENP